VLDGSMLAPQPPLPGSWSKLVTYSRECMALLERVPGEDASLLW
jgi:hypothetical protein